MGVLLKILVKQLVARPEILRIAMHIKAIVRYLDDAACDIRAMV